MVDSSWLPIFVARAILPTDVRIALTGYPACLCLRVSEVNSGRVVVSFALRMGCNPSSATLRGQPDKAVARMRHAGKITSGGGSRLARFGPPDLSFHLRPERDSNARPSA